MGWTSEGYGLGPWPVGRSYGVGNFWPDVVCHHNCSIQCIEVWAAVTDTLADSGRRLLLTEQGVVRVGAVAGGHGRESPFVRYA